MDNKLLFSYNNILFHFYAYNAFMFIFLDTRKPSSIVNSFEKELMCRELGIGVVTYSPLGRGFFAGKAVQKALPAQSILVGLHSKYFLLDYEYRIPMFSVLCIERDQLNQYELSLI